MRAVDVVDLTQKLIQRASVTPDCGEVFKFVEETLASAGFACEFMNFQTEGHPEVQNLFAHFGRGSPHICFAGHVDVVPVGDESAWTHDPFSATLVEDKIYGRGAVDMKGAVAAFMAAAIERVQKNTFTGTISLLITGDEESIAIDGTKPCLEKLESMQMLPDFCLVGEPTSEEQVGDMIKNGRRGSLSGKITVFGKQGHVAYPHRAENPVRYLTAFLNDLQKFRWDNGNKFFEPSNLEVTSVNADNIAGNVIPGKASAFFNIRFNTEITQDQIEGKIRDLAKAQCPRYELEFKKSAQPFLNKAPAWSDLVSDAIEAQLSIKPKLSTSGGTSDARFIHTYCPVVECGLLNQTAHQIDEHVPIQDLEKLKNIYTSILDRALAFNRNKGF